MDTSHEVHGIWIVQLALAATHLTLSIVDGQLRALGVEEPRACTCYPGSTHVEIYACWLARSTC